MKERERRGRRRGGGRKREKGRERKREKRERFYWVVGNYNWILYCSVYKRNLYSMIRKIKYLQLFLLLSTREN
jgi:hypothetical protein